jgi:transposase
MWHVGIDLHRRTVVIAAVHDTGELKLPIGLKCSEVDRIATVFKELSPFRAVIEGTGTYRWLYELLSPLGTVLLAHPLRLRAMVQRRTKTDRLDAQLLAHLLRMDQIPFAHIPSPQHQMLRDLVRQRIRLGRGQAEAKVALRWILARHNIEPPYKCPFGPRGMYWFSRQDFGIADNQARDELIERIRHYQRQIALFDQQFERLRQQFPEAEVLLELHGVGLLTGMTVIAELGDVMRFRRAKQVGAYSGLTTKINQSGGHCYSGHITKQGSPWLRWVLVEAAMKLIRQDVALANFHARIRKRSSAKIARVAAARKLAEICWKRLVRWHMQHEQLASA